ncbi:hypothetical protein A2U01_0078110 [Trifolium medium]|uniref:Uncharacterized protein n=1 Tax=Trifolium medium TaxID=97028 RepID=A0A392T757_9FABA|nr:hypothetical protein [Trifolium medium]
MCEANPASPSVIKSTDEFQSIFEPRQCISRIDVLSIPFPHHTKHKLSQTPTARRSDLLPTQKDSVSKRTPKTTHRSPNDPFD